MSALAKKETKDDEDVPDMKLGDITEGENERGIPAAKFIDDIEAFTQSFTPPASSELLIGAYSDLLSKYRAIESSLGSKQQYFLEKIPDLEKSLTLIRTLLKKKEAGESGVTRYSLADNIYAKADIDFTVGTVNLWLGANVMLEYTYEEALEFLTNKEEKAKHDFEQAKSDLAFVRDQIVTSEVQMSRIFNWDVRRKRAASKK